MTTGSRFHGWSSQHRTSSSTLFSGLLRVSGSVWAGRASHGIGPRVAKGGLPGLQEGKGGACTERGWARAFRLTCAWECKPPPAQASAGKPRQLQAPRVNPLFAARRAPLKYPAMWSGAPQSPIAPPRDAFRLRHPPAPFSSTTQQPAAPSRILASPRPRSSSIHPPSVCTHMRPPIGPREISIA